MGNAQTWITILLALIPSGGLAGFFLLRKNALKISAETAKMHAEANQISSGNPIDVAKAAWARIAEVEAERDKEQHEHGKTRRERNWLYQVMDAVVRYMNRWEQDCLDFWHTPPVRPPTLLQYIRREEQVWDDLNPDPDEPHGPPTPA